MLCQKRKGKNRWIGYVLLFVFMFSYKGWAVEENKLFDLGEIVVTGTPVEEEGEELPFVVTVITREDIEKSKAKTFADVLSAIPGVFVHRVGAFGRTDPEIRGRGERGRNINILIDGVPVKMSIFGCAVTHSLPIANVERIEVIRGPHSVLYGSDALGGVINIITRRVKEDGFWTDIMFSGGTYNTFQTLLSHGGKTGKFDYFLTADKIWSDGHREDAESDFNSSDYTMKLGYDITDTLSLSLFGKYFRGKQYKFIPAFDDYERTIEYINLSEKKQDYHLNFTLSHNYGHHRLKMGTPGEWHSKDHTYGIRFAYTTFAFENNELTFGSELNWMEGKRFSGAPGSWDRNDYGIYLWNKHQWDNFSLTLGGRYQKDSIAGGEFCPQGGISYKLTEASRLRAQVSKAFRLPALNDIYFAFPAREYLKPEKVWSYEAGMDQRITKWLEGNFTFFVMDGEDLIEGAANTGDFHFKGVEAGLEANWKNGAAALSYTWLDPGDDTMGRPGNKIDLIYRQRWSNFSLYSSLQHVRDYYAGNNKTNKIDNFIVVNSRLSYDINKNLEVFAGADNIFDENYSIYANIFTAQVHPMPGRTFTVGMRGKF